MCREYTSGYNALFAVEEVVLDRFTQALYDDPEFRDTYTQLLVDKLVHVLFPRPRLWLDGDDEVHPVVIELDPVALRIQAYPVPSGDLAVYSAALRIAVRCPVGTDPDTGNPVLQVSSVEAEGIDIEVLEPDAGEVRELIDSSIELLKLAIPGLLLERIGDRAIPLDDVQEPLLCDSSDAVVCEDPSSRQDRDALNLGLYAQSDSFTTQGEADDITYILEDQQAFTLQISRCLFSELVNAQLDRTYMRFVLEVPDLDSGESFRDDDHRIELSRNDTGALQIEGRSSSTFANLSGTVRNQTNEQSAGFLRGDDGRFMLHLEAEVGDTLEFRGEYFVYPLDWKRSYAHVPPPDAIDLSNGHVRVRGDASVFIQGDRLSEARIDLAYSAPITFRMDPITGTVGSELGEPDITGVDRWPGILWFGFSWIGAFFQFMAAICLAPLKNIVIGALAESDTLSGAIDRFGLSALTSLDEPSSDFHFFLESINVLAGYIAVSGQLEAGRIESAGQRQLNWVRLYEDENWDVRFEFDATDSMASCSLGVMTRSSSTFERLGIGDIEELTAAAQNNSIHLSHTELERRQIFALRFLGRCAKVRVDPQEDGRPIIRWVTFQRFRVPSASISGAWESEITGGVLVPPMSSVSGASRYWGEFSASTIGLHESDYVRDPLRFEWKIEPAYGTLEVNGSQCTLEIVTAEDLPDDNLHRIELRVTATDIFGRTVTSARSLEAERVSWSRRPWPRSRDSDFYRIDPHDPELAKKKTVYAKDEEKTYTKDSKLNKLLADAAVAAIDAAAYAVAVREEERSTGDEERSLDKTR